MEQIIKKAMAWRDADPDPDTVAILDQTIIRAQANDDGFREDAIAELRSAFAGPLEFGTAGLRGPIGPGPARMNRVVVTQAAAGFAAWLKEQGHAGGKVIVGHDARHKSDEFAEDTARAERSIDEHPELLTVVDLALPDPVPPHTDLR